MRQPCTRYSLGMAAILLCLTLAAQALAFEARIGEMGVTLLKPWYLVTHGLRDAESLYFLLMDDGEIAGEGSVRVFPAAAGTSFPTAAGLRAASEAQLLAMAREFDRQYTEMDEAATAALVTQGEATGIMSVVREDGAAGEDAGHSFRFYFPLGDKLVFLFASLHGDEQAAAKLERICRSFNPEAPGPNALSGDGISLEFPPDWDALLNGIVDDDQLWGSVSKATGEEGQDLEAQVAVLSPVMADEAADPLDRLHGSGPGEPLVFYALGARETLEHAKVTRTEPVTLGKEAAMLTVISGRLEGHDVVVELRDIPTGDKRITMVTGYRAPLPETTDKELRAIYASFSLGDKEGAR